MLTVLGEVEIERPYYLCGACHQGQFPFDRELDVADTQYSPGVRRMMALVGSESSFEGGREQLRVLAGLEVTTKAVERARTREVKLGCVFTQSRLDTDGRPLRDEASTSYTAAIETAEQFGRRIWQQAWQRGWSRAKKKVVIGDGAVWIWNLSQQYFADAVEIVDLYHARSICGSWRPSCGLTTSEAGDAGPRNGKANSTGARSSS